MTNKLPSSTRITFELDKQQFETTIETISRSSFLMKLVNNQFKEGLIVKDNQPIFIDRSGKNFHEVLQVLRDPSHKVDSSVASDLDFFLVKYDPKNIVYHDEKIRALEEKYNQLEEQHKQLRSDFDEWRKTKPCINCKETITNENDSCWECYEEGWDIINTYVIVKDKGKILCSDVKLNDQILNYEGTYSTVLDIDTDKRLGYIKGEDQSIKISHRLPVLSQKNGILDYTVDYSSYGYRGDISIIMFKLDTVHVIKIYDDEDRYIIVQTYH